MRSMIKRTLILSGHCTSVALEPEFWSALEEIAARGGQSLAGLVAVVDAERGPDRALASALRVFALSQRPLTIEQ